VRIPVPPLPDDLAGRGTPTGVPDDEVERVALAHVLGDRLPHARDSRHAQPAPMLFDVPRTYCRRN